MDKNTANQFGEPARFRRLGAAGIEIKSRGKSLAVDPYFTRIPFWKIWTGGVTPNRAITEQCLPQANYILVTHSHFDHLMDVPVAIQHTEAVAFGSRNTCRVLKIHAIPPDHRIEVHAGEHLDLGEFQADVLQAPVHSLPGFRPGPIPPYLKLPLKARDYSTDDFYSFLISVNNLRILHGVPLYPQKAARIDLWLPGIYLGAESREYAHWMGLIRSLRPKVIIPVHWDNFFRPLSRPEQPVLAPSGKIFPPLQRWNINRMRSIIQKIDPEIKVLWVERMQENDITELITMVN